MKLIRVLLIIAGILLAALLIVPLFSPSPAGVSEEIEIALDPCEIFPLVASFHHRDAWDPWITSDSTAVVTISPNPGYVGSTYGWEGNQIGTGRMEVIEVKENRYILSSLWFGDLKTPSRVEWTFEPVEGGTRLRWSFSQETTYPLGRLGMMFGKGFLKKSFETGLSNLRAYLESMPHNSGSLKMYGDGKP
jgi:uncharacterized protein YndB with AHSA1/START domain